MTPPRPLLDFLHELATSTVTRRAFEHDPRAVLQTRGLDDRACEALLSGRKKDIDLALLAETGEPTP